MDDTGGVGGASNDHHDMSRGLPPSYPPEKHVPRHVQMPQPQVPEEDDGMALISPQKPSRLRGFVEIVGVVVAALVMSVVFKTFFFQAFYVPSGSMESTLMPSDRIAVNMMASGSDVHRGDVVVFVDPDRWLADIPEQTGFSAKMTSVLESVGLIPQHANEHLVKRVIGLPGDHIVCSGAGEPLEINGVKVNETYLDPGTDPSLLPFDVTVPAHMIWVMGDNRANSSDSRFHQDDKNHGFVPMNNVVGRVSLIFYPLSQFGGLPDGSAVFANVPQARGSQA